jgi:hypothetical protein
MSDTPTPRYILKVQALSNGKIERRATILVLHGDGKTTWFTHKADLASQHGLTRAAHLTQIIHRDWESWVSGCV